jgi:nucleotide-binding universal stress UspA family protein
MIGVNRMDTTSSPSVVAGVDGSASSAAAVDVAVAEANLRQWPLTIVHASRDGRSGDEALGAARARVEQVAPDLHVTCEFVSGTPPEALGRLAGPDGIIVVGARGLGAAGSMLLGSVSHALVSDAPCPVVVVRTEPGPSHARVVVGIGSEVPTEVVAFAFDEASRRGAELLAAHAWESGVHFAQTLRRSPAEVRQEVMEREEEVLRAARAPWELKYPDLAVRPFVSTTDPSTLIRERSLGADLVVLGRGSLTRTFAPEFGSTVHALLHASACPVVVVPGLAPARGKD